MKKTARQPRTSAAVCSGPRARRNCSIFDGQVAPLWLDFFFSLSLLFLSGQGTIMPCKGSEKLQKNHHESMHTYMHACKEIIITRYLKAKTNTGEFTRLTNIPDTPSPSPSPSRCVVCPTMNASSLLGAWSEHMSGVRREAAAVECNPPPSPAPPVCLSFCFSASLWRESGRSGDEGRVLKPESGMAPRTKAGKVEDPPQTLARVRGFSESLVTLCGGETLPRYVHSVSTYLPE